MCGGGGALDVSPPRQTRAPPTARIATAPSTMIELDGFTGRGNTLSDPPSSGLGIAQRMASTTVDSSQSVRPVSGLPLQPRGSPAVTLGGEPAQVPGLGVGRIKTRTLIVLRLLGVVGQAGAIVFVGTVLRFPLPYLPCSIIVGVSALFNLVLMVSPASRRMAKPWQAGGQPVFGIAQIAR